MTRAELVAAAQADGANHLASSTLERFCDEAAREFTIEELWSWRITETTVQADDMPPIAVSLLGPIDSVRDSDRRVIAPRRHSELVEMRADFTEIGTPRYYWRSATNAVSTVPQSNVAVTVRHFNLSAWTLGSLEALNGTDEPRAPEQWHDAILLLVMVRCRLTDRDKDGATMLWERYQTRLEQAKQAELRDNFDEPDVQRSSEVY